MEKKKNLESLSNVLFKDEVISDLSLVKGGEEPACTGLVLTVCQGGWDDDGGIDQAD